MSERKTGIECLGYRPTKKAGVVKANVDLLLLNTRLVIYDCTLWEGQRGREVRLPARWQKSEDGGGKWIRICEFRSDTIQAAFSAQAVAAIDRFLSEREHFQ